MSIIGLIGKIGVSPQTLTGLISLIATLVTVGIFIKSRAWRPGTICGPQRLPADEPAAPLVFILIGGISLWMLVPTVILKLLHRGVPLEKIKSSPMETVILGIIGGAVPFGFMVLGTLTRRLRGMETLGFSSGHLKRAVAPAVAAGVFILPLVAWVAVFSEWMMRRYHIQHPSKHELLEIMDESPGRLLKMLIAVGAVIVAPLFEEFLFRGHIQTILLRVMSKRERTFGFPMITASGETVPPPQQRGLPEPLARWLAVLFTSVLFALVHHWSIALPIFVLSLCLGYMYERTGNLWVSVLMHAMFNGFSILLNLGSH